MGNFRTSLKGWWYKWLVLAGITLFFGYLAAGEVRHWWSLRTDIERTQDDITLTQEEIAELSEELTLVSDPAFLEKEARKNLNVKREGEEVLVVVGLEEIKQEEHFSLQEDVQIEEEHEMWENVKSWWRYFFN